MSDNREFIEEFLVESGENLDQLDRDLLAQVARVGAGREFALNYGVGW